MTTALYRHYDNGGTLLYVGVSLSALQRLGQHAEHSKWFAAIARVSIEHHDTREAALAAERRAITTEHPRHNIKHRDDVALARREAEIENAARMSLRQRESRDLVARVVELSPTYSVDAVASALSVSRKAVLSYLRAGQLGHITLPTASGKHEFVVVTGWQLLEFIESRLARQDRAS